MRVSWIPGGLSPIVVLVGAALLPAWSGAQPGDELPVAREAAGGDAPREATILGRVTDLDGQGRAGITVTLGDEEAVTGDRGWYRFDDVEPGDHLLRFGGEEIIPRAVTVRARPNHPRVGAVALMDRRPAMSVDAEQIIRLREGPVSIEIPAGALVPEGEEASTEAERISGLVDVSLTVIDPSDERQLFAAPAPLLGIMPDGGPTMLSSYMMFSVTLRQRDRALNLRASRKFSARVRMELPEYTDLAPGERVPMWTSDPARNLWIMETVDGAPLEALAVLTEDGGIALQVDVSHFSDWNADRPANVVMFSADGPLMGLDDHIHLIEVSEDGGPASPRFAIEVSPVASDRFYINLPQCGMIQPIDGSDPPGTYFKIIHKSASGTDRVLRGSSAQESPDGANIDGSGGVFSAEEVCDYLLDGGAHQYEPNYLDTTCGGSTVNCDGSICGVAKFVSDGSGAPFGGYGTCDRIAKSTDGPDAATGYGFRGVGMSAPLSFGSLALPDQALKLILTY